jgi:hypothetical protein
MSLIRLKIVRASEHLDALKLGIEADAARYGNKVIVESQGKETINVPEPSEEIAILAGEIVYQLRSALDHLAFDLVELNRRKITLPVKWDENCMFPTWTSLKGGQKPPLPYGVFQNLPGIPKDAHTIIERVQPYYGPGIAAINNYLGFLVALSNIDKHRRFALTRTRAVVYGNAVYESGIHSSTTISLDHGAEVPQFFFPDGPFWKDPIVQMDRSSSLYVTFNERAALGGAISEPIEKFLDDLIGYILSDVVIPLEEVISDPSKI